MVWDCFDPQPESTIPTIVALTSKSATSQPALQCDYELNCIDLFKKIEEQDWFAVCKFADSGNWPGVKGQLIPDVNPESQASTVVVQYEHHVDDKPTKVVWRRLPLQQAIMSDAPFAVIRRLVQLFPEGVRWANNDGQLALHLALLFGSSDDVISYLISEYPEGLKKKTKLGFTPLQAAMKAENRARGMMIAVFVHYTKKDLSSDGLAALSSKAMNPNKEFTCEYSECIELYKKIEAREWTSVSQFLETGFWPTSFFGSWSGRDTDSPEDQAKTWVTRRDLNTGEDLWSQLPLHLAFICGAPFEVTSRLIELYPEAVLYTDDQGMLPIHLALLYNAKDDIVSKLLLSFPEAVNKESISGLTPLDCALRAKGGSRGRFLQEFIKRATPKEQKDMAKKISKSNISKARISAKAKKQEKKDKSKASDESKTQEKKDKSKASDESKTPEKKDKSKASDETRE